MRMPRYRLVEIREGTRPRGKIRLHVAKRFDRRSLDDVDDAVADEAGAEDLEVRGVGEGGHHGAAETVADEDRGWEGWPG